MYIHLSIYRSIYLSIHLSIYTYIWLTVVVIWRDLSGHSLLERPRICMRCYLCPHRA